jgi:formylmethanofuran dehydrogenase subunit E
LKHKQVLADRPNAPELLTDFHGHLGPYVVAGCRAGRYALKKLGADPHFGIEAEVCCPDCPPVSCFLDGVQFATGCTLGKRNIRHIVDETVRASFVRKDTGESIWLALNTEAMRRAVEAMMADGDEAGAAVLEEVPDQALFIVLTKKS